MTASEIVVHSDTNRPQHLGDNSPVLVSGAARGWSDLVVEHQRLQAANLSGYLEGHLVSLQIDPTAWDGPSEVINVMLRANGIPSGVPVPGIVRDPVIAALCLALAEHLRQPVRPADALFARSMRDAITARLQTKVDPAAAASLTSTARLSREEIAQVDKLIHADLAADLSVRDLARSVAMSQAHFSRAFRATTGQRPTHI